jgi:hypothetical protein
VTEIADEVCGAGVGRVGSLVIETSRLVFGFINHPHLVSDCVVSLTKRPQKVPHNTGLGVCVVPAERRCFSFFLRS